VASEETIERLKARELTEALIHELLTADRAYHQSRPDLEKNMRVINACNAIHEAFWKESQGNKRGV
jgi:hypothetical protein